MLHKPLSICVLWLYHLVLLTFTINIDLKSITFHNYTCTVNRKTLGDKFPCGSTKRSQQHNRRWLTPQEMQRVTRQAFNDYVMDILDPATDTNAKRLYSYVKSQKKDSNTVGPLRDPDGQTYSSPGRKANILNDQFASVFTVEDEDDMPELEPAPFEAMPGIDIHINGVA